jgi:cytochrome c oxidase subunit 1
VTAAEIAAIHMPAPSYWPLILAFGLLIMLSGLLVSMVQVVVGGLWTLYAMYRFAMECHRPPAGHAH